MTTDKTPATLTTVKHGGCVQLGDWLPPIREDEPLRGDEPAGEQHDARMFNRGWNACRDAALSARPSPVDMVKPISPSPGGQDALREAAEFARSVLAEIYATYQVKIGPFASQAQLANVKLGAALAARQPVGEPVAVSRMVSTAPEKIFLQIGDGDYSDEPFPHPVGEEITWCSDSIVESEVAYVRSDLAAPRAHTVDLSRFRSLARWVANSAGHGINSGQRRMGEELLALIDSQAVGNGQPELPA